MTTDRRHIDLVLRVFKELVAADPHRVTPGAVNARLRELGEPMGTWAVRGALSTPRGRRRNRYRRPTGTWHLAERRRFRQTTRHRLTLPSAARRTTTRHSSGTAASAVALAVRHLHLRIAVHRPRRRLRRDGPAHRKRRDDHRAAVVSSRLGALGQPLCSLRPVPHFGRRDLAAFTRARVPEARAFGARRSDGDRDVRCASGRRRVSGLVCERRHHHRRSLTRTCSMTSAGSVWQRGFTRAHVLAGARPRGGPCDRARAGTHARRDPIALSMLNGHTAVAHRAILRQLLDPRDVYGARRGSDRLARVALGLTRPATSFLKSSWQLLHDLPSAPSASPNFVMSPLLTTASRSSAAFGMSSRRCLNASGSSQIFGSALVSAPVFVSAPNRSGAMCAKRGQTRRVHRNMVLVVDLAFGDRNQVASCGRRPRPSCVGDISPRCRQRAAETASAAAKSPTNIRIISPHDEWMTERAVSLRKCGGEKNKGTLYI